MPSTILFALAHIHEQSPVTQGYARYSIKTGKCFGLIIHRAFRQNLSKLLTQQAVGASPLEESNQYHKISYLFEKQSIEELLCSSFFLHPVSLFSLQKDWPSTEFVHIAHSVHIL